MAIKEDILEQIVEEYLLHNGYFVRRNLKFRPEKEDREFNKNKDSNHSDIDVIGFNPLKEGADKVWVVSCKSWQEGFNPQKQINAVINGKILGGREAWKGSRELWKKKWADAFIREIISATGQEKFTYFTAVTKLIGNRDLWEHHVTFSDTMRGNPIKILELKEMVLKIEAKLSTTVASTDIGRVLQLFKAAGLVMNGVGKCKTSLNPSPRG